jgi:PAS domain S-box-containing protein
LGEQKKFEGALHENEEIYKFIVGGTKEIILIIDKMGKILFANRRTFEVTGYTEKEMIGKSITSFLTKDSIKTAFYALAKEFLGQHQKEIELKIKTKSGEIRYLEVAEGSVPVREKDKTVGILVTGLDITEHKEAEEELKTSEQRFRTLFEYAPDAYYLNDMKGNFLEGNLAAEKLTGYKKDELLGGNMFKLKLLSKEQLPKAAFLLAKNALGKSTGPDEFVLSRKDGSKVSVEIMTYSVKMGKQKLTLGIARDVTERKKAEEALRRSEAHLKEAQSLGRIGSWEFDVEKQTIVWSEETYVLYEHDPKLGPPSPEEEARYYSAEQAKTLRDYAARAIETGKKFSYDLTAKLPSGRTVYLAATMRPVKDERGRVVKLFGTVQDITNRKIKEEELIKRTEESERFSKLSVGRELKMVELKKRISELENQIKNKSK